MVDCCAGSVAEFVRQIFVGFARLAMASVAIGLFVGGFGSLRLYS